MDTHDVPVENVPVRPVAIEDTENVHRELTGGRHPGIASTVGVDRCGTLISDRSFTFL